MSCMHLKKRSKKGEIVFYCSCRKEYITLDECSSCNAKEYKTYSIKKKSKKLQKIENSRDINLMKKGMCSYCHRYFNRLDPHEVYGGSNRFRSIKYGFVRLICRNCHESEEVIAELKKETQLKFEEDHSREEFIAIIGKSYI